MAALCAETLEHVQQGLSCIIPWSKLLEDLPKNLKISPLAAIPHSSQTYCAILDLYFERIVGGIHLPSVNAATVLQADAHAMKELGNVVAYLIAAMAAAAPQYGPIFFTKWDIKDSFWHMIMALADAWNFCDILPALPGELQQIVVPTSLPMGWCQSPPFFSTASETARDAAQALLNNTDQELPLHPLEHYCLSPPGVLQETQPEHLPGLKCLLEVFVDDFMGLIQAQTLADLERFT